MVTLVVHFFVFSRSYKGENISVFKPSYFWDHVPNESQWKLEEKNEKKRENKSADVGLVYLSLFFIFGVCVYEQAMSYFLSTKKKDSVYAVCGSFSKTPFPVTSLQI